MIAWHCNYLLDCSDSFPPNQTFFLTHICDDHKLKNDSMRICTNGVKFQMEVRS
ncbi:hypothetical protein IC582_001122 [Cucumis melo]